MIIHCGNRPSPLAIIIKARNDGTYFYILPSAFPSMPLKILYEDNHLLAVAKPSGLPTQGAAAGRPSLITLAKAVSQTEIPKARQCVFGSGISAGFAHQRRGGAGPNLEGGGAAEPAISPSRKVQKIYWAMVEGTVEPPAAECIDWLAKDEHQQRMMAVPKTRRGAQEARLSYRRLKKFRGTSLVEIVLSTGRKHQIRVQLADRGHPIVGDRKYGSERRFGHGIALHCRRLVIEHPIKHTPIEIIAPMPRAWNALES